MFKNLIKKGPQLLTAALLTVYPLFLLIASNAYADAQPAQLQQRMQSVEALQSQANSYLDQIQQKIRSSLTSTPSSISLDTLSSLESSIEKLKAQGATTSNLESQLASLKVEISTYNNTVTAYNAKTQELAIAQTNLETAVANLETSTQQLTTAQANLQIATEALATAQSAYSSADASLTSQIEITSQALQALNISQANLSTATSNKQSAQYNYDTLSNQLNQLESNINSAYQDYLNSEVPQPAEQGLNYTTYTIPNNALPIPSAQTPGAEVCTQGVVPAIDFDWGGGIILGCQSDFVLIHYTGYLKFPSSGAYTLYAAADDGFLLNINGSTVIDDWTLKGCSGINTPTFQADADTYYAIDAWAYEWGGGACTILTYLEQGNWNIFPASSYYLGLPSTTRDPSLYEIYQQAIALYQQAVQNLAAAALALESATSNQASAQTTYSQALTDYNEQVSKQQQLQEEVNGRKSELDAAQEVLNTRTNELTTSQSNLEVANNIFISFQASYNAITQEITTLEQEIATNSSTISDSISALSTAISNTEIPPTPTPTPTPIQTPEITPTPEPQPQPEEVTQEQRDELLEAAQADDIQIDPQLEAIPVVGAIASSVVDAINYMSNVGADMTPTERKKAQQTVVATLIVGQVAQTAATAAAASASASASRKTK